MLMKVKSPNVDNIIKNISGSGIKKEKYSDCITKFENYKTKGSFLEKQEYYYVLSLFNIKQNKYDNAKNNLLETLKCECMDQQVLVKKL